MICYCCLQSEATKKGNGHDYCDGCYETLVNCGIIKTKAEEWGSL